MKVLNSFLFISFLLILGCAEIEPQINWNDPASIASKIEIKRDDFKKQTEYKGPNCSEIYNDMVFIRAWKHDYLNELIFQIYVMDYYNEDWRFYTTAWDSDGNRLETIQISRDVGYCGRYGCSHYEHIGLNISKEYLESKIDSGLQFEISGKGGKEIFSIPPSYIRAFLNIAKWATQNSKALD